MSRAFRVVVLAAQRKGVTDPLAQRFGTSHKCLVPLAGQPLIAHVLRTLDSHPRVESVAVSIEPEAVEDLRRAVPDARYITVPSADNIADSVTLAAQGHTGPLLITTADNALLTHASIDAMMAAAADSDAAVGMTTRGAVLAAHPEGQRRFYRFRDGEFSNCNLYCIGNPQALRAAEIFRGGGQFAKKAQRIVDAFGLANLILLRLRLVGLGAGLRRVSARMGLDIAPVILSDGSQAIDVDNDRTYAIVETLLSRRVAFAGPSTPAA